MRDVRESRLLIWWTPDGVASEMIGENPNWARYPGVPDYVKQEYDSRVGRAGKGRLWVPPGIDLESIPEDECPPGCGGIVFEERYRNAMRALPGFITAIDIYTRQKRSLRDG